MASVFLDAIRVSVLACAVTAASAASAQEGERSPGGLLDRIFGGSERFGAGERVAQPSGGQPGTERAVSSSDLAVRFDRLEAQIRQLTGAVEQLQYRNQQLEQQVRRMQEDTEHRFQELGTKGASRPGPTRPAAAPAPTPPAGATAPGRRGDAFDPTQHPNAPGAPRTLGPATVTGAGPPAAAGNPNSPLVGAPRGRAAGSPLDVATVAPPSAASPGQPPVQPRNPGPAGAIAAAKEDYDLAYGHVLSKDYPLAEESFRNFLTKHPSDQMAGEATFWLGESLFQRQRYRDAAEAFLNVSTKFEANARGPDALLRLGQSLAALGEKEAACAALGEVGRKFPRASASLKQSVEREQKRVRC